MAIDQYFYGRNSFKEAVSLGIAIDEICVQNDESFKFACEFLKSADQKKIKRGIPQELSRIQDSFQGIAFRAKHNFYIEDWREVSSPFIVLCNHLEDVHNLGAITRSAVAFGAGLIVHESRRSVSVNAAVVKSSAGQAFRMKYMSVSNLAPVVEDLKETDYRIVAIEQGRDSRAIGSWKPELPLGLVLGSESSGVSDRLLELADEQVHIPVTKEVESLNVSVAASIALQRVFEANAKYL